MTEDQSDFKIQVPPEQQAGVSANYAAVSHGPYGFTIDFMQLHQLSKTGVVVARINASPLFYSQLLDALESNWAKYAKKTFPPEVDDEGGTTLPPEVPGDDDDS